jgi:cobalamin biosynthesis Co2+ chelatase CbiK
MDPNSSFMLKIKFVDNSKKKARQDLGCYTFTKVVDANTTNFRDFVESIVDEFPPRYKEKAIVQYFDGSLQALPKVKTYQDLQLMFDKHAESKVVHMSIVYYDPSKKAPQLVTEWPPSPLEENKQNEED